MAGMYDIKLPTNVWRPKVKNKYIPLKYGNDIHNGVFDFIHCGNTVFRAEK